MSNAPQSGPRARVEYVKAHVMVTIEATSGSDDFDIEALLATEAALQGLDVPGGTVLRVSVSPHDGVTTVPTARGA